MVVTAGGLGRREPTDWKHVEKYPLRALPELAAAPASVERILRVPSRYRPFYDQDDVQHPSAYAWKEGGCGGFGSSWMMSFLNGRAYDPYAVYLEAQKIDEWPGEDYEGTSTRAVLDVLRKKGHRRYYRGKVRDWDLRDGIYANRWATTVDEVRACIKNGVPVLFGMNWFRGYDGDNVEIVKNEHWIGRDPNERGELRGGHIICCYGASDERQGVKLINSWGLSYPLVWLPYDELKWQFEEQAAEAAVVTDR